MGGEEFAGKYRDQLLHELEDSYVQFKVKISGVYRYRYRSDPHIPPTPLRKWAFFLLLRSMSIQTPLARFWLYLSLIGHILPLFRSLFYYPTLFLFSLSFFFIPTDIDRYFIIHFLEWEGVYFCNVLEH
jgi:hypothetical protein